MSAAAHISRAAPDVIRGLTLATCLGSMAGAEERKVIHQDCTFTQRCNMYGFRCQDTALDIEVSGWVQHWQIFKSFYNGSMIGHLFEAYPSRAELIGADFHAEGGFAAGEGITVTQDEAEENDIIFCAQLANYDFYGLRSRPSGDAEFELSKNGGLREKYFGTCARHISVKGDL